MISRVQFISISISSNIFDNYTENHHHQSSSYKHENTFFWAHPKILINHNFFKRLWILLKFFGHWLHFLGMFHKLFGLLHVFGHFGDGSSSYGFYLIHFLESGV